MAFLVTAANALVEIPLHPSGTLTYFHLNCTADNLDTDLTMAIIVVGITTHIGAIESMANASLVDAYDAGGAGAANLEEEGGGTAVGLNVVPGVVGTGGITFRGGVDGIPIGVAAIAGGGWEVVVGIAN